MAPNQALEARMAPNQALEAQMVPNRGQMARKSTLEAQIIPNRALTGTTSGSKPSAGGPNGCKIKPWSFK